MDTWFCCSSSDNSTVVNCKDPTTQTVSAKAPASLKTTYTVPSSVSTTAASSTTSSVPTSIASATSSSTSSSTLSSTVTSSTSTQTPSSKSKSHTGAIVGGVVGGVAAVVLLITGILLARRRIRRIEAGREEKVAAMPELQAQGIRVELEGERKMMSGVQTSQTGGKISELP